MAVTKISDLINPQVMADMIEQKYVDLMKFAPLATIDTTLQGRPGNTITLPNFGSGKTSRGVIPLRLGIISSPSLHRI